MEETRNNSFGAAAVAFCAFFQRRGFRFCLLRFLSCGLLTFAQSENFIMFTRSRPSVLFRRLGSLGHSLSWSSFVSPSVFGNCAAFFFRLCFGHNLAVLAFSSFLDGLRASVVQFGCSCWVSPLMPETVETES